MDTWIYVAGWTLVHFVWQGAVIAVGAAVGLYMLRAATPNVRYMFASAALILMLGSLVATAALVSSPASSSIQTTGIRASSIAPAFTSSAIRFEKYSETLARHADAKNALRWLPRAFPVIVMAWLSGVAILLVRLLTGWWRVRALQRAALSAPSSRWQEAADRWARRLGIRRRVCVTDAETIETPTVIGWWRPVIVLPMVALSGLTPSQAEAVLMHELAHIRRHDYLVNLLQHVAETVLFYHPAVWWVSHRMRVEREQCCDAIVVDLCADPLDYATALTRLEEARQPDTALVLAATGGSLIGRVRRLLSARTDRPTTTAHVIVTTMMIALVVVVVVGGYQWSTRVLHATVRNEATARPARLISILDSERMKPANLTAVPIVPARAVVPVVPQERPVENVPVVPVNDISLAVEVNYFQLNRAEYAVPVSVRIPGNELALARNQGAARTTIEFSGEVKDAYGITVQRIHDKLDIALSDDNIPQIASRQIQYETTITLLPGRYDITLQARDAETGRAGTFQTSFAIPNLNKVDKQVPISTVVLGNQLVRFGENAPANNADPLVHDGLKLIPSVTRVFSKARDLYIYLQAYEPDATVMKPLVAFATLYRGDTKALETEPLRVTAGLEGRAKAVSLLFTLPLGDLSTGRYDCEVTVTTADPDGQKVTSWRAPVDVVP